MTNEEKFVNELIGYIFDYPDDDYMAMECLCRKLHKHELIAKVNGHWQPLDKRCEECIFVEGSHWCNGCDKTPKGMKEYDEYWAKADCKTEPQTHDKRTVTHECVKDTHDKTSPNNSEKPNNCENCKHHFGKDYYDIECEAKAFGNECKFEPKDEPQTIAEDINRRVEMGKKEWNARHIEDEPQTCSFSDCDNFKNPDYARCIECKRKQIKSKDEPQTERHLPDYSYEADLGRRIMEQTERSEK